MSRTDLDSNDDPQVRAAGGVLLRDGPDGTEVAVIHRPKYEDWSLPKGKLDGDEDFEQAALREVKEETGMEAELGPERSRTPPAARTCGSSLGSRSVRDMDADSRRGRLFPI